MTPPTDTDAGIPPIVAIRCTPPALSASNARPAAPNTDDEGDELNGDHDEDTEPVPVHHTQPIPRPPFKTCRTFKQLPGVSESERVHLRVRVYVRQSLSSH